LITVLANWTTPELATQMFKDLGALKRTIPHWAMELVIVERYD